MKINYKIKEVHDGIFLCTMKDRYDLCMTFCRAQEFYESPLKIIRGKKFNLLEFFDLYRKANKQTTFTYPDDWEGFNIPGDVVKKLYNLGIDDYNQYDQILEDIHNSIKKQKYYLIGAVTRNTVAINHEICHGLYYLNKDYKRLCNNLIEEINKNTLKKLCFALKRIGYCEKVLWDEIQAYLATGYNLLFDVVIFTKKEKDTLKKISKKFKKNFNVYYNS